MLRVTLLACETSAIVQYFERSLALPFFGIAYLQKLTCNNISVYKLGKRQPQLEDILSNHFIIQKCTPLIWAYQLE